MFADDNIYNDQGIGSIRKHPEIYGYTFTTSKEP